MKKHWEHRPEPAWENFQFNQPYAKGLKRLKEEVLAKTDFDPATPWHLEKKALKIATQDKARK